MKNAYDMVTSQNIRWVQQRIVSLQLDMVMRDFCDTMNKYYQSTITYREKYKQRIKRQIELGYLRIYFLSLFTLFFVVKGEETEELLSDDFVNMFPDVNSSRFFLLINQLTFFNSDYSRNSTIKRKIR